MKTMLRFLVMVALASVPALAFAEDGVPQGDGDGLKAGAGPGEGAGEGFVDADGDGICDKYQARDGARLQKAYKKGAPETAGQGTGAQARHRGVNKSALKGAGEAMFQGKGLGKGDGDCDGTQVRDRDRLQDQTRQSK